MPCGTQNGPRESCSWRCLLGLEMLPMGEQHRHHTCLPENKPQLGQNPVVLLALTRPFNFAIFSRFCRRCAWSPVRRRAGGADPLAATNKLRIWLMPGRARLQEVSPSPGGAPCAAPAAVPAAPRHAAPAAPPPPAGPDQAGRAQAARDPWRRRVELRTLPPHVCRHSQSPPRGALGSAHGRRRDWPRVAE